MIITLLLILAYLIIAIVYMYKWVDSDPFNPRKGITAGIFWIATICLIAYLKRKKNQTT